MDDFFNMAASMPHMVWTAHPDGKVDFISHHFKETTGRDACNLDTAALMDVIHPEDRARSVQAWRQAVSTGQSCEIEFRIRHEASSGYRWHLATARPTRDEAENVLKWYGSVIDVHDRKIAEMETRRAHDMLSLAGRVARIGGWFLDVETGRVDWSPEVADILKTPANVVTTLDDITRHVAREWTERFSALISACLADGEGFSEEFEFVDGTGKRLWVSASAEPDVTTQDGIVTAVAGTIQDITAVRDERDETELRLRGFLDAVPAPIWSADPDGRLDYVNRVLYETMGRTPGDLNLSDWLDLVHPDDRADAERCIAAAYRDGRPYAVEMRLRYKDGSYRWFMNSGTPLRNDAGRIVKYYGTVTDIQQVKDATEALRQSEARYRSIFDLVPVSIWEEDWSDLIEIVAELKRKGVTDFEDYLARNTHLISGMASAVDVLNVNSAAVHMFGAPGKDELAASFPDIFSTPGSMRAFTRAIAALARGKSIFEAENIIERHDGRTMNVLARIALPDISKGETRALISELDITERKHAEERFRLVAQITSDVVWDHDLVEDRVWCSEGFRIQFGHDPEAVTRGDLSWEGLLHPDDMAQASASNRAAIRGEIDSFTREYRLRRADGTYAHVRDQGFAIRGARGKPVRIVGSLLDISDQRQLEDQLRASQRLDAIGQLTGGVAHDFNNLLMVILGNAELLVDHLSDTPQLRDYADVTATAAMRGADLTRQLLAFARKQPLDPRTVDINDTLRTIRAFLERTIGEHIRLTVHESEGLRDALVDSAQLESAILNLCLNARDAMPNGGHITIEAYNTTLDEDYAALAAEVTPGDYVAVCVTDTGHGMDAAMLSRAFEPFFTTKDVGKGNGLGLSTIYGFVKQSNGHVAIYSEPGHGTAVKIYLPCTTETDEMTNDKRGDQEMETGSERILLVEDDNLVRDHVESQLLSLGYDVDSVGSGPQALEILRKSETPVDLLFTDMVMPDGMDGSALAVEARKLYPDLPVLFTSGYTANSIFNRGHLDGAVDMLQKPYRRKDLAVKLREVLRESPAPGDGTTGQTADPSAAAREDGPA